MPAPEWSETVKESNILEQIWVKPQSRRNSEHGDPEENQPEYGHSEEESNKAQHSHTQVPNTKSHFHGPQWEHDDCEDHKKSTNGVQFLLDLGTFIQPNEMKLFSAFLLLLNLNSPKTLCVLRLVGSWGMVMAFMRIGLGNSEGEEGKGEQLECVFEGGAVGNFRE